MRLRLRSLVSKISVAATAAVIIAVSPLADARDDRLKLPLADALAKAKESGKLASGVQLFFGKQAHATPTAELGATRSNKKTNFFGKKEKDACEWAFLSAMISLTKDAQDKGGNAIINIRSNYKDVEFSSETEYECGAGNVSGGTAFVGTIVKLP
jgi:uncharacterized protein YbjQ (UPF0145 family)